MNKQELATIPGTDPGSVFFVIGEDEEKGFRGAIRFWMSGHTHLPYTSVGYRFRVERSENAPTVANFPHALRSAYPGVAWKGGSSHHGSVTGEVRAKLHVTDSEELVKNLKDSGAFKAVFRGLQTAFPTMRFICTEDEFSEFSCGEVQEVVGSLNLPKYEETGDPKIDVFVGFVKEPDSPPDALEALMPPPSEKNAALVKEILSEEAQDEYPDPGDGAPNDEDPPLLVNGGPPGDVNAMVVAGGDMSPEALKKAEGSLGEFLESQDASAVAKAGGIINAELSDDIKPVKKPKKSASLKLLSGAKDQPSNG